MFLKTEGRLPAGSVVLLKDSTKKVMIMGFCQNRPGEPDKIYDYCGCLYSKQNRKEETETEKHTP